MRSGGTNFPLKQAVCCLIRSLFHGPLTRYLKSKIAHTGNAGVTFSSPPPLKETASQRSRHEPRHVRDAHAVMNVGIANPRWAGKRSRHSRRMRNSEFWVSG